LRGIQALPVERGLPGYTDMWVGGAHAELGDSDAAYRLLERSVEERRYSALMCAVDRAFRPLHHELRFEELRRRVGVASIARLRASR
jgi:hypothetical protein